MIQEVYVYVYGLHQNRNMKFLFLEKKLFWRFVDPFLSVGYKIAIFLHMGNWETRSWFVMSNKIKWSIFHPPLFSFLFFSSHSWASFCLRRKGVFRPFWFPDKKKEKERVKCYHFVAWLLLLVMVVVLVLVYYIISSMYAYIYTLHLPPFVGPKI